MDAVKSIAELFKKTCESLEMLRKLIRREFHPRRKMLQRGAMICRETPRNALKECYSASTWHELEDPICCGQSMYWQGQSPNCVKLVTKAWADSQHEAYRKTTGNVVVWETVSNSVNMDYCKTLHVQDTRKSPSPRLMERCASSGQIRPCLCDGFARIKKQCHTAVPSLRSFRFRLDWALM